MSKIIINNNLKTWFLIHFIIDSLVASLLLLMPVAFLEFLGWQVVDPVATRIVAAALFAIGLQSFLMKDEGLMVYKNMLYLKILWSSFAIIGLVLSIIQGYNYWGMWLVLGIFIGFKALWWYWCSKLSV